MDWAKYIKQAQEMLIEAGYSVGERGADGIFGQNTLEALKEALGDAAKTSEEENQNGGIFTVVEAYPFVRQLKIGDEGEDVVNMQRLLLKWHMAYYLGQAADDGIFGGGTRSALMEFQKGMGQKPDSIATEKIWNMLNGEAEDISYWVTPQQSSIAGDDGRLPMECNCNGRYCDSTKNAEAGITSVGLLILIERIQKALRERFAREDILVRLTDDMDTSRAEDRNGGNRCETWNSLHGGAQNSQHTKWKAADLFVICPEIEGKDCPSIHSLWEVADELNPYGGVGEYGHNIHVDTRGSRARW